ncbi:hypothetical protein N7463_000947 [Penicillium fimorum]|uniref:Uncharacterized protein n=1 Tax=Penicillium fimorum TaxID=1882269 RepID=A0A9W9Y550_9EURO|nr:hypothetical protein N7463_000947 [Penicillium fimorum]
MELVVTLAMLAELTKELVMLIDNATTPETNHTNPKANTTISTKYLPKVHWFVADKISPKDRNIDPMNLLEQVDIGILVAALARALPDGDGDIPMQ